MSAGWPLLELSLLQVHHWLEGGAEAKSELRGLMALRCDDAPLWLCLAGFCMS